MAKYIDVIKFDGNYKECKRKVWPQKLTKVDNRYQLKGANPQDIHPGDYLVKCGAFRWQVWREGE